MAVVTEAVGAAIEAVTGSRPGDVPRMTWHEAMERFGSDKPDTRFGMELVDLGAVFAADRVPGVPGRRGEGHLRPRPGRGQPVRRSTTSSSGRSCSARPGLVWMRVKEGGALEAPILKFLTDEGAARDRRGARRGAPATSS